MRFLMKLVIDIIDRWKLQFNGQEVVLWIFEFFSIKLFFLSVSSKTIIFVFTTCSIFLDLHKPDYVKKLYFEILMKFILLNKNLIP